MAARVNLDPNPTQPSDAPTSLQDLIQGPGFQSLIAEATAHFTHEAAQSRLSKDLHAASQTVTCLEQLGPAILQTTATLPESSAPYASLHASRQQLLRLRIMRAFVSTVIPLSLETFQGAVKKEVQTLLTGITQQFSSLACEEILSAPELLQEWVEEIIAIQAMLKPFVPPLTIEESNSKGVFYEIKKLGKTYGYLLGTFHYAMTPEMVAATKCSHTIHQKLSECTIIGTEVTQGHAGGMASVESNVLATATSQAIFNFGIDALERNAMGPPAPPEPGTVDEELLQRNLSALCQAYREGDLERIKALGFHHDKSPRDAAVTVTRNAAMTKNIHACLSALETVAIDRNGDLPKGFFAVGFAHVLSNDEGVAGIPELLTELGWELDIVPQ